MGERDDDCRAMSGDDADDCRESFFFFLFFGFMSRSSCSVRATRGTESVPQSDLKAKVRVCFVLIFELKLSFEFVWNGDINS